MSHQAFHQRLRSWRGWPVVVLAVLATTIPEILTGSTTLSIIGGLPVEMGLYGPGALVIREIVRRRGGGWPSMLILGAVYAAIEEGLLEPTWLTPQIFPPNGHPYGVAFGIFWPYAAFNIGLHSIWSMTLPILLTETIFHRRRHESWLGGVGISVAAVAFVFDAAFTWMFWRTVAMPRIYGVHAEIGLSRYLGVALFAAVLTLLGWWSTKWANGIAHAAGRAPSAWAVGPAAAAGALLWFGMNSIPDPWLRHMPIPAILLSQCAIGVLGYLLIREWSTREGWQDRHRLAVFAGALGGETLGGYWLFHRTGADLAFEIAAGVVAVATLVIMAARISARPQNRSSTARLP